jgi:Tfp pilus assembly protein PilX
MSVCNGTAGVKCQCDRSLSVASDERGMAFLTVVMVLLMLTVLGIAAITVSGLENNMAGLQRTMEASANAAESCLGIGANIIQQVYLPENADQLPAALLDNNSPPGPVPNGNKTVLQNELMGNPANSPDVPTGPGAVPNLVTNIGPYAVAGDIDYLYIKRKVGSGQCMACGYDSGSGGGGGAFSDMYFRISCVATTTATGTESRISAVYACSGSPDGCQRQP